MAFKLCVRSEIAAGLDETHRFEHWADQAPGTAYYDVHTSVIERHETCVPTLRRILSGKSLRILESGCGTGRWMVYLERLGQVTYGIDDSAAPLLVAKTHAAGLRLARADAVASPFPDNTFDAAFSSYVAEHFADGPEPLFREIHRVLKPDGLLLVVVPYNNLFRKVFTNRVLTAFYWLCRLRGVGVTFTEFHYSRREMDGFLQRSGFRIEHIEPDDFRAPWAKGLSEDLGRLVAGPGSWEMNRAGRLLARTLNSLSPWICCSGIFYAARATKS